MKLEAGKHIALVGHSGCGKSTCIQLLLRFYDIESGELVSNGQTNGKISRINKEPYRIINSYSQSKKIGIKHYPNGTFLQNFENNDIQRLNVPWLRSTIGLVSQEPVLFDRTIAENIMYGDNSREVIVAK